LVGYLDIMVWVCKVVEGFRDCIRDYLHRWSLGFVACEILHLSVHGTFSLSLTLKFILSFLILEVICTLVYTKVILPNLVEVGGNDSQLKILRYINLKLMLQ